MVMVVDDEEAVREITRQVLEEFGYRVLLAADGSEAVSLFVANQSEVAVVLTDMMMPVMDGLATVRVLRRLDPDVPIIGVSGVATNGRMIRSPEVGVKHFLPKPYTAEAVLQMIRKVLAES